MYFSGLAFNMFSPLNKSNLLNFSRKVLREFAFIPLHIAAIWHNYLSHSRKLCNLNLPCPIKEVLFHFAENFTNITWHFGCWRSSSSFLMQKGIKEVCKHTLSTASHTWFGSVNLLTSCTIKLSTMPQTVISSIKSEIRGSWSGDAEDSSILRCGAVLLGAWFPVLWTHNIWNHSPNNTAHPKTCEPTV